jgi:hypothetical protein
MIQKQLNNASATLQQRFNNARPAAYTFSLVRLSIVGGFMTNGQDVVEHY